MKRFDEELQALRARLCEMGDRAERMIIGSKGALFNRDLRRLDEVARAEAEINRMEKEIDREAIRLITIYTPVATDLRFLLMAIKIGSELERVGDEAVNMAEYARLMADAPPSPPPEAMVEMGVLVTGMLRDALTAFRTDDTALARRIIAADDRVDALNDQVFRHALESEERAHLDEVIARLQVARSLERIGDHATNICEEVIYVVEARDVRHGAP